MTKRAGQVVLQEVLFRHLVNIIICAGWSARKFRGYEIRPDEMILGIYDESAHFLGNKIEKIKTEDVWVYVIKEKMNPYYVDVLNSKVVKKFLEFTHEVYKKELGEEFWKKYARLFYR